MTPDNMHFMRLELTKRAGPYDALLRAGRAAARSPGTVAAGGAAVGGTVGAVRGALKDRAAGGSGIAGAVQGGLTGAAAGGVLAGGAAGAGRLVRDQQLLNPALSGGQAVRAAVADVGKRAKNFGRRQIHGFTGRYADKPGEIGLRSRATAQKKIHKGQLRLMDELKETKDPSVKAQLRKAWAETKDDLLREGELGQELLESGGTSIPGMVRGLRKNPKRLGKALWHENTGGGVLGTTLGVGAPTAFVAHDLSKGDESATGGRSIKQKLVQGGAILGGGFLTGGMPIVPMMTSAGAIEGVADRATRRKEKRR